MTALQRMQKMSAALSHDLNNYTGIIQGYVELMRMELDEEHECQSYLDRLQQVCTKMLDRSRTLETFSARRCLPLMEMDLVSIVRSVCQDREAVQCTTPAEPVWIGAHLESLRLALQELLDNALEACPAGPVEVNLSGRCLSLRNRSEHPAGTDTQCWFEPFYSTRGKGRGLGLARVWGTLTAHGAEPSIEIDAQQNVVVEIRFPEFQEERSLE